MLSTTCDSCHWSEMRDQMTVAMETGESKFRALTHEKLRLDQPNYYAYFYFKESICSKSTVLLLICQKFCLTFWSRDPK